MQKTALVTGAASGIGRAIALRYATAGARVVVSDVDEDGGIETVSLIEQAGGTARFVAADVSDPDACAELVSRTVEAYSGL
ncbi:SDR family NAD(P)-dependent oxidoreductase, partial [Rubrivirga sp.]|uniref:SDR family NAD(P)-dependent oxidoreductase n=1 Tax=Rubrivirga sp. TaxID=1885344 RepID=UPI003C77BC22